MHRQDYDTWVSKPALKSHSAALGGLQGITYAKVVVDPQLSGSHDDPGVIVHLQLVFQIRFHQVGRASIRKLYLLGPIFQKCVT